MNFFKNIVVKAGGSLIFSCAIFTAGFLFLNYQLNKMNKLHSDLEKTVFNLLQDVKTIQANLDLQKIQIATEVLELKPHSKTFFEIFYNNTYITNGLLTFFSIIALGALGYLGYYSYNEYKIYELFESITGLPVITNITGLDTKGNLYNIAFSSSHSCLLQISVVPKGINNMYSIEQIMQMALKSNPDFFKPDLKLINDINSTSNPHSYTETIDIIRELFLAGVS